MSRPRPPIPSNPSTSTTTSTSTLYRPSSSSSTTISIPSSSNRPSISAQSSTRPSQPSRGSTRQSYLSSTSSSSSDRPSTSHSSLSIFSESSEWISTAYPQKTNSVLYDTHSIPSGDSQRPLSGKENNGEEPNNHSSVPQLPDIRRSSSLAIPEDSEEVMPSIIKNSKWSTPSKRFEYQDQLQDQFGNPMTPKTNQQQTNQLFRNQTPFQTQNKVLQTVKQMNDHSNQVQDTAHNVTKTFDEFEDNLRANEQRLLEALLAEDPEMEALEESWAIQWESQYYEENDALFEEVDVEQVFGRSKSKVRFLFDYIEERRHYQTKSLKNINQFFNKSKPLIDSLVAAEEVDEFFTVQSADKAFQDMQYQDEYKQSQLAHLQEILRKFSETVDSYNRMYIMRQKELRDFRIKMMNDGHQIDRLGETLKMRDKSIEELTGKTVRLTAILDRRQSEIERLKRDLAKQKRLTQEAQNQINKSSTSDRERSLRKEAVRLQQQLEESKKSEEEWKQKYQDRLGALSKDEKNLHNLVSNLQAENSKLKEDLKQAKKTRRGKRRPKRDKEGNVIPGEYETDSDDEFDHDSDDEWAFTKGMDPKKVEKIKEKYDDEMRAMSDRLHERMDAMVEHYEAQLAFAQSKAKAKEELVGIGALGAPIKSKLTHSDQQKIQKDNQAYKVNEEILAKVLFNKLDTLEGELARLNNELQTRFIDHITNQGEESTTTTTTSSSSSSSSSSEESSNQTFVKAKVADLKAKGEFVGFQEHAIALAAKLGAELPVKERQLVQLIADIFHGGISNIKDAIAHNVRTKDILENLCSSGFDVQSLLIRERSLEHELARQQSKIDILKNLIKKMRKSDVGSSRPESAGVKINTTGGLGLLSEHVNRKSSISMSDTHLILDAIDRMDLEDKNNMAMVSDSHIKLHQSTQTEPVNVTPRTRRPSINELRRAASKSVNELHSVFGPAELVTGKTIEPGSPEYFGSTSRVAKGESWKHEVSTQTSGQYILSKPHVSSTEVATQTTNKIMKIGTRESQDQLTKRLLEGSLSTRGDRMDGHHDDGSDLFGMGSHSTDSQTDHLPLAPSVPYRDHHHGHGHGQEKTPRKFDSLRGATREIIDVQKHAQGIWEGLVNNVPNVTDAINADNVIITKKRNTHGKSKQQLEEEAEERRRRIREREERRMKRAQEIRRQALLNEDKKSQATKIWGEMMKDVGDQGDLETSTAWEQLMTSMNSLDSYFANPSAHKEESGEDEIDIEFNYDELMLQQQYLLDEFINRFLTHVENKRYRLPHIMQDIERLFVMTTDVIRGVFDEMQVNKLIGGDMPLSLDACIASTASIPAAIHRAENAHLFDISPKDSGKFRMPAKEEFGKHKHVMMSQLAEFGDQLFELRDQFDDAGNAPRRNPIHKWQPSSVEFTNERKLFEVWRELARGFFHAYQFLMQICNRRHEYSTKTVTLEGPELFSSHSQHMPEFHNRTMVSQRFTSGASPQTRAGGYQYTAGLSDDESGNDNGDDDDVQTEKFGSFVTSERDAIVLIPPSLVNDPHTEQSVHVQQNRPKYRHPVERMAASNVGAVTTPQIPEQGRGNAWKLVDE